jgi:hypothetical protein
MALVNLPAEDLFAHGPADPAQQVQQVQHVQQVQQDILSGTS